MTIAYMSAVAGIAGAAVLWMLFTNIRVVKQYERGVVYRFGRVQPRVREPGLNFLIPIEGTPSSSQKIRARPSQACLWTP